MDENKKLLLDALLKDTKKKYGEVVIDKSHITPCNVIRTGSLAVDIATGIGGIPRGRLTEISGEESCLDKDTFIPFYVVANNGKRPNTKGGTIKHLYERFHDLNKHHATAPRETVEFFSPCKNDEGRIFTNKIMDVVHTGDRECIEVETKLGYRITATPEHKFLTGLGFQELSKLSIGDTVYIHNNTPFTKEHENTPRTEAVCVKHHPMGHDKIIAGRYPFKRIEYTRMVYEAHMNNLSTQQYRSRLNSGDIEGLRFLPNGVHVHHANEDALDNRIENLVVIDPSSHGKIHATERHNNLRFTVVPDEIVSMRNAGTRETYDIKMLSPHNNYIASHFVVHNSGKTTLSLQCIAEAQRSGGICAFIDAEHALDAQYAKNLGVNMDELIVSQPDTAEEIVGICLDFAASGLFSILTIDSVAAMIPRAVLEGEVEDKHMAIMGRLMSQNLPKIVKAVSKTDTAMVFINQMRSNMGAGGTYGPTTTTTGGKALKFYCSLRLSTARTGSNKDGEMVTGNKVNIKVLKNKLAAPFTVAETNIKFGEGYDVNAEIIDLGVDLKLVEKSGSWYSYNGERMGQGRDNSGIFLNENPVIRNGLIDKIRQMHNIK